MKGNGRKKLREAEATARRLLDATPESEPKLAIGFPVVADTEEAADA